MKAIILAAGYAVRLQPLTLDTPKPLLFIGKKRMVDRILDKIVPLGGLGEIYVVSNGKFFQKFEEWHKGVGSEKKIAIINDGSTTNENRLGAIKDLELVITSQKIDEDLLVVAGDNLFDFRLEGFLEFARSHPDGVSVALYDVKNLEAAKSFGVVKIDADSKVTDFEEKPQNPRSTLASTGIYYFPKNKLPFIKEYVKMLNKLDAPGYYIGWLAKQHKVYGYTFLEDWYDIGTIESYKKADSTYTERER